MELLLSLKRYYSFEIDVSFLFFPYWYNIPLLAVGSFITIAENSKKIVEVLDNFDSICSDLNIDLPADVVAHQKNTNTIEINC